MKLTVRGVVAAVFVLVMCGVCVRLGFWQLDRLRQRKERNAAQVQAARMPVLDLDSATAAAAEREPYLFINRHVRATGVYDPAGEVVLRGRAQDGQPGVHLVTPLIIPGVAAEVLVNRGFVPSPDAASVDARRFAEPGTRTVVGVFQEVPRTKDGGQPSTTHAPAGPQTLTYRRLDLDALRAKARRPVLRLYVQQLPDSTAKPGYPLRVPLPELGNGPHLSYAVQWFSFAAIGLAGLVVMLLRQRGQNPG